MPISRLNLTENSRFNEKNELLSRYVEFNLQQLIKVAVNTCNGAQSCAIVSLDSASREDPWLISWIGTKITKCSEGLHNKAFILTMDNGSEVFAKLPNPNAGPAHFTVASEVATRELVRQLIDLLFLYIGKLLKLLASRHIQCSCS